MKILDRQVLNGPNYWSNFRKKLVIVTLDLEQYEELPTNLLPGFSESLKKLLPTLAADRCSIGEPGGFFLRLNEGTWLGHVIEHVALELQCLAGSYCGFGRTYGTNHEGVYKVIFTYQFESVGLEAANMAVELVETLACGKEYSLLEEKLAHLRSLVEEEQFGPSTQAIVDEAQRRNIPVKSIKDSSIIVLGHGCRQKKMWATVSTHTSSLAADIAANKDLTKNILAANFIPVPRGITLESLEELDNAINAIDFPLVIKPLDGNHGRGIATHINSRKGAVEGFELAKKISDNVIVEQCIKGDDYRFLVINYQFVAAAKRTPAMITGTGKHTIQELIDITNADPKRGVAHENVLTTIKVDDITLSILMEKNLSLSTILAKDEIIYLKGTANLSSGGTATDVTDLVHPANVRMAEQIARLIDLDICGIDIMAQTITEPINKNNGAVIEVNAGPGFRMHLHPTNGTPRNVAAPILDMLFPTNAPATIPIVAVTGTNGKTTVVRLIANFAKKMGQKVGFTTTEGIYRNDDLVFSGDCSGPASAASVLADPWVDYAVLECARGGIIRSGLGFDNCDISVITNISGDHLGIAGIDTLEDLAQVKSVVAFSTKKEGCAILNAQDDLVYALKEELKCRVALFALAANDRIKHHCQANGLACYIENDFIVIQEGDDKHYLAEISDIPLTFKGTASCMIQNILPAVLAGFVSGFNISAIANALYDFVPTSETLPGRMNIFNFDDYKILIDYAHNEGAYIELKNYLSQIKNTHKVGVISATGDRRSQDIQKIGFYSAQMFDEIIIKHDKDGRGSSNEELTQWLQEGIEHSNLHPQVRVISDEFEAVRYAMEHSIAETFIFYTPEDVTKAIEFVKTIQKETKKSEKTKGILYDT